MADKVTWQQDKQLSCQTNCGVLAWSFCHPPLHHWFRADQKAMRRWVTQSAVPWSIPVWVGRRLGHRANQQSAAPINSHHHHHHHRPFNMFISSRTTVCFSILSSAFAPVFNSCSSQVFLHISNPSCFVPINYSVANQFWVPYYWRYSSCLHSADTCSFPTRLRSWSLCQKRLLFLYILTLILLSYVSCSARSEYLGPKGMQLESGEAFTMRNFIVCTVHLI